MGTEDYDGQPGRRWRLVVGLGNPGAKYAATRHNIGFRVVDRLAAEYGIDTGREKFSVQFGRGRVEGLDVVLAKPMAYMNLSGPPVRAVAEFFRIALQEVLVVHDDIDLEYGRIKIKAKGGHGGHNGIRSVINAFGGGDFTRLRVGIGRSGVGVQVADYVLDQFTPDEAAELPHLIDRARDAVVTILCKGTKVGMNQFNMKPVTRTESTKGLEGGRG
jgi:PTH1 family peptidyl-tRNA hydrolase